MYITNRKKVDHHLLYKDSGGGAQRKTINASSTVNIPEITEVSQVLFKPWERKAREINNRINGHPSIENANAARFIDTEVDYKLVLTGSTV